jgi:hypothetical protein
VPKNIVNCNFVLSSIVHSYDANVVSFIELFQWNAVFIN